VSIYTICSYLASVYSQCPPANHGDHHRLLHGTFPPFATPALLRRQILTPPRARARPDCRPDGVPRWTNHRSEGQSSGHFANGSFRASSQTTKPIPTPSPNTHSVDTVSTRIYFRSGSGFGAGSSTTYITCSANDCKNGYPNQAPSELSISVFLRHRAIEVIQLLEVCVT
jgi:hypothetical protein